MSEPSEWVAGVRQQISEALNVARNWRPDRRDVIAWFVCVVVVAAGLVVQRFYEWQMDIVGDAMACVAGVLASVRMRAVLRRPHRARFRNLPASLADILALTPAEFEHFTAALCRRDGARTAEVVGGSNDRALDVVATFKRRGRPPRRVAIQCKRWASKPVAPSVLYEVNGTYRDSHRCSLAVLVTTSKFTPAAREFTESLRTPIVLVDGAALVEWAAGGVPPWSRKYRKIKSREAVVPLGFRKSFRILPGVRLNLNKGSWSVTLGSGRVHETINSRGRRTMSVRLGRGLSWRKASRRR